jgi:DNA-binding LytR/AlgR family response regulator
MPTALIAEDESVLRRRLRGLLESYWPDLQIVAEAEDGAEALATVNRLSPDITFLDIQMPKLSGLDVAHAIRGKTLIVFLTAHAEHALEAFDVGAVDYLLKPIQPGRLVETVERLKSKTAAERLAPPSSAFAVAAPRYRTLIQASVGTSLRLIFVSDVAYFQSDARYTRVVTTSEEHFVRKTIKELTTELNPEQFVQIGRGCIVNLYQIKDITRAESQLVIQLKRPNERLTVSPGYHSIFKQL